MVGKEKDEYLEYIKFVKASLENYYDIIKIYGVNKVFMRKIIEDLEVLEIIKKKLVDIGYISSLVTQYTDNLYVLEKYNGILSIPYQLTLEELLKLKQWLEENENDR